MTTRIWKVLFPYSNTRNILLGLGIIIIVNVVIFPYLFFRIEQMGFTPPDPLDLELVYTPEFALDFYNEIPKSVRSELIIALLTIDNPYALVYGLTFVLLIQLLFRELTPNRQRIILLPLLAVFFDFLENIFESLLLYSGQYKWAILVSVCTPAKWFFLFSTFLVLLTGLFFRYLSPNKLK